MTIVAGVDSSTQSCKVVIREAETGKLVRHGRSAHPEGTEVHSDAWWMAPQTALDGAGGLTPMWPRWQWVRSSTGWCASMRPAGWCGRLCCGTTLGPPTLPSI
jgi:hypothetical protein